MVTELSPNMFMEAKCLFTVKIIFTHFSTSFKRFGFTFPLKCQTNSWFAADQLSPWGVYIRWSRVFVLLCADSVGACALVAQVIWK